MLSNIDFASCANDNTPDVVKDDIKEAIESLKHVIVESFQWFSNSQMKSDRDKCHLITSKSHGIVINVEN